MAQYYVSSTGSDTANGTSTSTPWKTLTKVQTVLNNGTIVAGDTISFKKGDTFTGKMLVANIWGYSAKSGTNGSPITLNSYGSGNKPKMLYPAGGSASPSSRTLMQFIGVDYYVIDGLNFTDTDTSNNHVQGANLGFPIYLGSYGDAKCNHWTIQNVDISLCGMGVVIYGDYNTVTGCNMSNFKNLVSTSGGNGEDYGANPFTLIWANNNVIRNNYVTGGWSESLDFGYNGGFCETIGTCSNNQIIYNTIIDCNGLSEFGQGGNSVNNLHAYNKLIDCGAMYWVNGDTQVTNLQFFNNTVIETNNSRFSQGSANEGAGVISQEAIDHLNVDVQMFGYSGNSQTASTVFNLKNNVFQVMTPLKIARTNDPKLSHTYNVYKLSGGSALNQSLGAGEVATSAAIFEDTTGSDATLWNLRPVSGSLLINAGTPIVGLTVDLEGNTIASTPDAGTYERVGSPILSVTVSATTIACIGGTSTVTVAATGGTAPYTGTGSFTKGAGTHTYTVTDSAAASGTVSITVAQPAVITATVDALPISVNGGTTTVTVSNVAGGVGPYTYNIDGGSYSSTPTFAGVLAGAHTVNVKDSNACIKSFVITVTEPANILLTAVLVSKTNVTLRPNGLKRNGSAVIAGVGGTLPYSYNRNGGSYKYINGVFSQLSAGTYSLGVKDATGQKAYVTVTIQDCRSGICI